MKKLFNIILFLLAISFAHGQDLGSIKKKSPFRIRGNIGASTNYYSSNEVSATRPPWSWNLYGNFSPEIYGISLPVSFLINQYGNSFTQPFAQFGISPSYKWAKLHLGYRSLHMSPLVFSGQSFRGAGIELNPGIFRFAAFYGKLNRRVNEDTTSGRYARPQYSRIGYGAKLGIGNGRNFFDIIYFQAKDDSTSAKVINKEKIHSQENSALGASFKTTILNFLSWSGDFAASAFTEDITSDKADSVSGNIYHDLFGLFIPIRNSTSVNFGGQTAINISMKNYNTSLGYRRIDPGFKSLGTPYMLNDIELINWTNNLNLMNGGINVNTNISNQHNNLKKNLTSELSTFVSSLNTNIMASKKLNMNFSYSGYLLKQKDGTMKIKDSVRMNQQIHQVNFMPSYTFFDNVKSQTISAVFNYMLLDDRNPVTSPSASSHNLSASLNYNIGISGKDIGFNFSGMYNQYVQDTSMYNSYGVNVGSTGSFLKKKNLNVQANVGYMLNRSTFSNTQSNLTFSLNFNYRIQRHSFGINANYIYTPYNPINEVIEKTMYGAVATKNFMGGISYNYTF